MSDCTNTRVRLSAKANQALLKIAQGGQVGPRWCEYLTRLGLVQPDLFTQRLTLTADGKQQLGLQ